MKQVKRKKFKAVAGRKLLHKRIKDLIWLNHHERSKTKDDYDNFFYLLGVESGLEDGGNRSHRGTIELLIASKNERKELMDDVELFRYEIEFQRGYCDGLEKVLNLNRELYAQDVPVLIIAYVPNDDLYVKYESVLFLSGYIYYSDTAPANFMYYISKDINDITGVLATVKNIDYSILAIYTKEHMISRDDLVLLSENMPEDIFLVKDSHDTNVESIIANVEKYCCL